MNEQSIYSTAHPPLKIIFLKYNWTFQVKTILPFNLSIAVWQFWDFSCWSKKDKNNITEYSTFHTFSTLF